MRPDVFLHLSHTDVRYDGRILKQMQSLDQSFVSCLIGVGVEISEDAVISQRETAAITFKIFKLHSKSAKFLPRPLRYFLSLLELTTRMVWIGLRCRPKAVQCHDTLALPSGVIIKLLTRARLVYDAHELESAKGGQSRILSVATLFIERLCWPFVDLFISVSQEIVDWYEVKLGQKDTIVVLNAPPEQIDQFTNTQKFPDDYLRQKFHIAPERPIFLYIGVFVDGRCINELLEIFSEHLTKADLVLLGYCYGDYTEKIKALGRKAGNIHIHPPVEHGAVVAIAGTADVGLCFIEDSSRSDYFSLPNKLFEYVNAGIPVLGSDFPALKRVIDTHKLGATSSPKLSCIKELIESQLNSGICKIDDADINQLTWKFQSRKLVEAYSKMLNLN